MSYLPFAGHLAQSPSECFRIFPRHGLRQHCRCMYQLCVEWWHWPWVLMQWGQCLAATSWLEGAGLEMFPPPWGGSVTVTHRNKSWLARIPPSSAEQRTRLCEVGTSNAPGEKSYVKDWNIHLPHMRALFTPITWERNHLCNLGQNCVKWTMITKSEESVHIVYCVQTLPEVTQEFGAKIGNVIPF